MSRGGLASASPPFFVRLRGLWTVKRSRRPSRDFRRKSRWCRGQRFTAPPQYPTARQGCCWRQHPWRACPARAFFFKRSVTSRLRGRPYSGETTGSPDPPQTVPSLMGTVIGDTGDHDSGKVQIQFLFVPPARCLPAIASEAAGGSYHQTYRGSGHHPYGAPGDRGPPFMVPREARSASGDLEARCGTRPGQRALRA